MAVDFNALDWSWLRSKRGVKWSRPGSDLIPAWVADMDFPACPAIAQAIITVIERGDLGYPAWDGHPLAGAFAERMDTRYGWAADPGLVRGLDDVIQGVELITYLLTEPGETVVTFEPNYPPFLTRVPEMGRRLATVPIDHDGRDWAFDPEVLARALSQPSSRILLMVNPHNPTGHVFSADELNTIAEIACSSDVVVICDEIHADLVHGARTHIPLASLGNEIADRTVTLTSATKAFNIAGVRCAVAHVGPPELRKEWDSQPHDLFGVPNVFGVEATLAAWQQGDDWLADLRRHLAAQREYLGERRVDLPGISCHLPDATYLAWLDCRRAGLPGDPAEFFRTHASVELSSGKDFGSEGYARLNFATSRQVLETILDAMANALHPL